MASASSSVFTAALRATQDLSEALNGAAAAAPPTPVSVFERSTECPGAPTKGAGASEGATEASDFVVANLADAFEVASINDAYYANIMALIAGVTPDLRLEVVVDHTGVSRGRKVRGETRRGHHSIEATIARIIRETGLSISVYYTRFADEAMAGMEAMFKKSRKNVDRYLAFAVAALRLNLGDECVVTIAFIQSGTTTTQVGIQKPDGSWEYELFETGSDAANADEIIRLANWLNQREVTLVLDCGSSGYTTLPQRVAINDSDFDQTAAAYPHVAALRRACSTIASIKVYAVPHRVAKGQPMWTVVTAPVVTDRPGELHLDIGGKGSTRPPQHGLPEVKVKFDQRRELFPDSDLVIDSAAEYGKLDAYLTAHSSGASA